MFRRQERVNMMPTFRGYRREGLDQVYDSESSVQVSMGFGDEEFKLMKEAGVIEIGPGACQALNELAALGITIVGIEPMANRFHKLYLGINKPLIPKTLRDVTPDNIGFSPYIAFANGVNFADATLSLTDFLENISAGLKLLKQDPQSFLCFWLSSSYDFHEEITYLNQDRLIDSFSPPSGVTISRSNLTLFVNFHLTEYLSAMGISYTLSGLKGIRIYAQGQEGQANSDKIDQTLAEIYTHFSKHSL